MNKYIIIALALLSLSMGCNKVDTLEEYYEQEGITPLVTDNGLAYTIHSPGDAEKIKDSDFIMFHFSEMNVEGKEGASSDNGTGLPINYKVSELISWLQDGLHQIGVGGDATLYVSPKLIYRVRVLRKFDTEVAFNDAVFMEYIDQNGLTATRTDDGLYYVTDRTGNGRFPSQTTSVTVDYKGYFLNGLQFDSSYDRGMPATFSLQGVIQGWTKGVPLFDEGSKGTLFVPSYLAYGQQGNQSIPPNSPLIFDIELINF